MGRMDTTSENELADAAGHALRTRPVRLRPVLASVGKDDFPETFSVYLELMEVGEGRTKILLSVGKFYEYMLRLPHQIKG